jgi:hypothetical protein
MLDFASTQALAKELAPPVRRREARAEAVEANSTSTSPLLTIDGLHRMYTHHRSYFWKLRDVLNRRQAQVDQDAGYPHELP